MPKKKKNDRKIKNHFFIFCEGRNTEPEYLNHLIADKYSGKSNLIQVVKSNKNTPKELVADAVKHKKENIQGKNDKYWVLFDCEGPERTSKDLSVAFDIAEREGLNIAVSNVSFEIWFLWHFTNSSRPFSNANDLIKNSGLKEFMQQSGLKKYSIATSKKKEISKKIYPCIKDKLEEAVTNGRNINNSARLSCSNSSRWNINPYCEIINLLDALDNFNRS